MLQGLKRLYLYYCMRALRSTAEEALWSAVQQHIQTGSWCTLFLLSRAFLSERSFEIVTKKKTKHFKKFQGDRELSTLQTRMPYSRNLTFKSLNLFSSDMLQSSRICMPMFLFALLAIETSTIAQAQESD